MESGKRITWAAVLVLALVGTASADLTDGLLAYYPFNGNANDQTGNGHNGIVTGATLTTDRFGNPDSAYSFDGADDYIEASNPAVFGFHNHSFSVSVWVKVTENRPVYETFVGLYSTKRQYHISKWRSWDVFYTEFDDGPSQVVYFPDGKFVDTWYHLVSVVNVESGHMEFYGNGTLGGTNDLVEFDFSSGTALGFGMRPLMADDLLGSVDDVRIYGRALSGTEIAALYTMSQPSAIPAPGALLLVGIGVAVAGRLRLRRVL